MNEEQQSTSQKPAGGRPKQSTIAGSFFVYKSHPSCLLKK